jgi:hypothetical protein
MEGIFLKIFFFQEELNFCHILNHKRKNMKKCEFFIRNFINFPESIRGFSILWNSSKNRYRFSLNLGSKFSEFWTWPITTQLTLRNVKSAILKLMLFAWSWRSIFTIFLFYGDKIVNFCVIHGGKKILNGIIEYTFLVPVWLVQWFRFL